MPRYKDNPEIRTAKQERREKLRELLTLMEAEDVRDLKSEFEAQSIRKNETSISRDIEEKIFTMSAVRAKAVYIAIGKQADLHHEFH